MPTLSITTTAEQATRIQRALAIFAETAAVVAAGVASTHKIPIRYNGATYYALVTNVA